MQGVSGAFQQYKELVVHQPREVGHRPRLAEVRAVRHGLGAPETDPELGHVGVPQGGHRGPQAEHGDAPGLQHLFGHPIPPVFRVGLTGRQQGGGRRIYSVEFFIALVFLKTFTIKKNAGATKEL